MRFLLSFIMLIAAYSTCLAQSVPDDGLNIDFLITYGNMAKEDCREEEKSQTLFIVIPEQGTEIFYVRVFDPDCGGENDNCNGLFETNTEFGIYGGNGCVNLHMEGDEEINTHSDQGTLLQEELFADEPVIDNSWVTFGPFTAQQGEKLEAYSGRFFKLIVEGKTGNDCNHYAVVLSSSGQENTALDGASLYMDENTLSADLQDGKYSYSVVAEPIDE
jgi:hypothetical protein